MKSEFNVYPLCPPLNQWVQFIWVSKGENDTTKSKVLPNGAIELIINFGNKQKTLDKSSLKTEDYFKDFWIAGFQNSPIIIQSESDTNLLGIRFLPGGAYPFLNKPVPELSDLVTEADWLLDELEQLRDQIIDLSNSSRIIHVVETYLLKKLFDISTANKAVTYVVNKIMAVPEAVSISDLVDQTGYSHKHFLSLFKQQVGTSPKNLQRILRLQKIIQVSKNTENFKWSDILYEFSYFDPAHFVYDFKKLTGMTPDQYLALRTFDENHCLIR